MPLADRHTRERMGSSGTAAAELFLLFCDERGHCWMVQMESICKEEIETQRAGNSQASL
jgi:hypothetical protein